MNTKKGFSFDLVKPAFVGQKALHYSCYYKTRCMIEGEGFVQGTIKLITDFSGLVTKNYFLKVKFTQNLVIL